MKAEATVWYRRAGQLLASRRWRLWALLAALVVALLGTVVWLAGRYEASQAQSMVERDASDALSDLRAGMTRNLQSLQALQSAHLSLAQKREQGEALLREHREWVRLEWRDEHLGIVLALDSPYRSPVFERMSRSSFQAEVQHACTTSRRVNGGAYAPSYFAPQMDATGIEIMDLCVAQMVGGQATGYVLATYTLAGMLSSLINPQLVRSHEVSLTEPDGTRLAAWGVARRGSRVFTAQQLLDLPGGTLVLRMDSWRSAPDVFPNVLTALVTAMSIALVTVLFMLGHDMRRRQRAEQDLAEALAFRKAMEDSLVTGLRARDLRGRTTYVNPAFCQMFGLSVEELLSDADPPPYWPPEFVKDYRERQEFRLSSGQIPPREGRETIFMRKDGTRFPVLIIEAPLINAQGVQTGWMSAVLDVSEQRRVEEISRATQERLQATARLATVGEMASLLSHELNQPLSAISSYATGSINLLQRVLADSGPQARSAASQGHDADLLAAVETAMKRISEQAERAGRVIKSVHDFVRRRNREREPSTVQGLLDAIAPLVNLQARKLGVRVETRVQDDLPPVLCDRTMVEQVLLNLARNAMQAMDAADVSQPRMVIEVRHAPAAGRSGDRAGWIEFSVADCGPGIPDEVKQQLFTPLYTTKAEGMGLGLSLCRTVVEQHGGSLDFEPNRPQGTIFRFTLPVAPSAS